MRLFTIMTILILTGFQSLGQSEKLPSSELDSMYFRTIQTQCFFLVNGTIYVVTDQFTERIKDIKELRYLNFMTSDDLIKESLKTRKNLDVIRVSHKLISSDTIDINISYLDVKARRALHFYKGLRFIKADFKVACGGTNGYVPTCRFVFDKTDEKWIKLEK